MATQVEHLKKLLARYEAKHGPDDPSVKDLKTQIASLESSEATRLRVDGIESAKSER